jgi:hypothetical protein
MLESTLLIILVVVRIDARHVNTKPHPDHWHSSLSSFKNKSAKNIERLK